MAGKKDDGQATEGTAKLGKKKLIMIGAAAAVLLAGGTGGGVYMMTKDAAADVVKEEVLVPGEVTAVDAISLNLAGGRYLKVGIALQGVQAEAAAAHGSSSGPDTNKAQDLVISSFSGLKKEDLENPQYREQKKLELQEKIIKAYEEPAAEEGGKPHKTVMGIYFTQFVMQ